MWICNECNHKFEEVKWKKICFEDEYGVGSLFDSRNYTNVQVCPSCDSREIEELEKCCNCEEYFKEEDLIDTEQIVNQGVGMVCIQCFKDMEY